MRFACEVPDCDKEAKIAGKCVKHACEAAKKTYGAQGAGTENRVCNTCGQLLMAKATGNKCERCRRKAAQQKYLAKNRESNRALKTETCSGCNRELEKSERVYKGKCSTCRGKAAGANKPPDPSVVEKGAVKVPSRRSPKSYAVVVDFTLYPTLYERLLSLSGEEMRPPEMELLYLIQNELRDLENRAKEGR